MPKLKEATEEKSRALITLKLLLVEMQALKMILERTPPTKPAD